MPKYFSLYTGVSYTLFRDLACVYVCSLVLVDVKHLYYLIERFMCERIVVVVCLINDKRRNVKQEDDESKYMFFRHHPTTYVLVQRRGS